MIFVYAHSKAFTERNQARHKQDESKHAQYYTDPPQNLTVKQIPSWSWEVKSPRKYEIEIKQSEWRNQEIFLVFLTEFHRFNTFFMQ